MTDNLRDRIAAVLFQRRGYSHGWDDETEACREMWRRDADAVIRELGLQKRSETGEMVDRDGGEPIKYGRSRYVTDWTTDD